MAKPTSKFAKGEKQAGGWLRRPTPEQPQRRRGRRRVYKTNQDHWCGTRKDQDIADALEELDPPISRDRVTITRWRNGKHRADDEFIAGVAKIVGTTPDSLMNRKPGAEAEAMDEFEGLALEEKLRALRLIKAAREPKP